MEGAHGARVWFPETHMVFSPTIKWPSMAGWSLRSSSQLALLGFARLIQKYGSGDSAHGGRDVSRPVAPGIALRKKAKASAPSQVAAPVTRPTSRPSGSIRSVVGRA